MKKQSIFKRVAACMLLAVSILELAAPVAADEIVQVFGSKNQLLGTYPATSVGTIAFAEAPDTIVIPLTDDVKFTMVKVEGGVDYTLKSSLITWTDGRTKKIEDFWIGKFEVTQGVWKAVMGALTDLPTTGAGKNQKVENDSYPMAYVSWEDIMAEETGFLAMLNAKLDNLKNDYPELKEVIGTKQFRLPSEWEWEYAAGGGKDNASLKYFYSGTFGQTAEDLQEVAVNSLSPNSATAPAIVGSKKPNALGLYDMSGNVWEWCSGLGYLDHTEAGFLNSANEWQDTDRPFRGGGWNSTATNNFHVYYRSNNILTNRSTNLGFRLVL